MKPEHRYLFICGKLSLNLAFLKHIDKKSTANDFIKYKQLDSNSRLTLWILI